MSIVKMISWQVGSVAVGLLAWVFAIGVIENELGRVSGDTALLGSAAIVLGSIVWPLYWRSR